MGEWRQALNSLTLQTADGESGMRILVGIAAIVISSAASAGPPAFCAADHSAMARLICADEQLSTIDAEVYGEFNAWRSNVEGPDREARAKSHGDWIRERNHRCGLSTTNSDIPMETLMAAKPCVLKAYEERKEFYDSVMWK
jgi:uncharacterized protein YecT (DUF1311 family)